MRLNLNRFFISFLRLAVNYDAGGKVVHCEVSQ